ncbi:MAG TPA: dephospho-CoA kinase [Candidatus Eisenbacteria bacterium]|jgi:dephospho-CoA kinase
MSTDKPRRANPGDGRFILGLVGRAGSGKTTVARAIAADGGALIEADTIGHQVTDQDPEVREALAAEYGAGVYRPDGSLDRARVAARVFGDREARARLDRLVHPRILERIALRLDELRRADHRGVVVVDAALMLDWGLERSCDAVLAVVAPERDQVTRLTRSRGWTEAEARARLAAQRTNEAYAAAADGTLENRGSVADLERTARALVARMMAERAVLRGSATENGC